MFECWAKYEDLDIDWLNKPSNPEVAFVHLAVSISDCLRLMKQEPQPDFQV